MSHSRINNFRINTPTVLLVDDSAFVRKRLCALLEDDGCVGRLMEANCALDAWLLFKLFHPDIVVLDLQLPDFNGMEVLRRIKQSSTKCVVIILSNCREPAVRDECKRHGADCFLHKATQFEKVCEFITISRR